MSEFPNAYVIYDTHMEVLRYDNTARHRHARVTCLSPFRGTGAHPYPC